jgi:glucose-6-phosphate-specific signal transduction histidine kinase
LRKFEDFHHSLKNLSDRLSPPFLEESFPLAIQHLLQLMQANNQAIDLELHLPKQWHHQESEFSRLMLSILDELLNIALAKIVKQTSVRVSLRELKGINKLRVQIVYPDEATLVDTSNSKELRYLQQSFQMLTLGQCFSERKELSVTWYFLWQ